MSHPEIARTALYLLCGIQAVATVAIDCNRTHATNPLWTGHARFHVVWQSITVVLLSVVEIVLIHLSVSRGAACFYLAAALAAVSPVAFLIVLPVQRVFDGRLWDPNGLPPLRIRLFGIDQPIDGNVVAVVAALASIGSILWIYRS